MAEYKNNLLVVDELIYDPHLPTQYIVRIGEECFMIEQRHASYPGPIDEKYLRPYAQKPSPDWRRGHFNYEFLMRGMVPRGGFKIELGRPITAEEFKELCKKHGLTDDDVSNEFEAKIGALYGEYAKTIKSVQIQVPEDETLLVEQELQNKGIQASGEASGRVNIRTDWGGYREGAGRKPSGRKLARMYVTEEEEQKLRDFLAELRQKD